MKFSIYPSVILSVSKDQFRLIEARRMDILLDLLVPLVSGISGFRTEDAEITENLSPTP